MVTKPQPQQIILIAAIIATVGISLIAGSILSSVYAQAPPDIQSPGTTAGTNNQTSNTPLLLGCKDGLALFKPQNVQSQLGLQMGCLVKPFNIKAFNGTKVLNDGNISSTGNVSSDICHTIFNGVHGLFQKDASGKFVKFLCSSLTTK